MKRSVYLISAVLAASCLAQDAPRSAGWVVIPIGEYDALRDKAYPIEPQAELPAVEATLTRLDYDLRIEGPVATGRATLTVDVLKDGWVRVPIPPNLLVREATLGGKRVSLVNAAGHSGQSSALLNAKGRSVLTLDLAFAVNSAGGAERLVLPTGGSAVTRASIAFPSRELEVKVTGGFIVEKSGVNYIAYGRGNDPLSLTWRKKIEERQVELPLRMRGSLTQFLGLSEDSTSLNADVEIDVVQGTASQVKIAVPDPDTINQVLGATVADWDVKSGELIVNFLEPVDRSAMFTISGEARLAREGAIAVPLLRLLGTERESGGVAVEMLGAGEIKDTKTQGLEPADAAELGPLLANRQSPSLAAFRFRAGAQAHALNIQVARYTQQAVLTANIEEARYRVMVTAEGKTLIQARYAVRNNQRNFVRVTLPAGAAVWSASLAGRPVRPGQGPAGSLLLPLAKGPAGDGAAETAAPFVIEILYLARGAAWEPKGRATVSLPALDLPVSRTGVILYYPPLFRVTPEQGAFRSQSYERATTEALNTPFAPSPPERTPVANATAAHGATQALVDRYRARSDGRKTSEAQPLQISFPAVGPSLYLVSELTEESKAAMIDLNYQSDKKGAK